ncbi:MAG: cytidylate kinase-like family protein, partial [Bacilli bacterium]|nr:cytidylate kinase-like family protein [Bacilli bacterium]
GINKDKASEILKKMDKNRASYYNYFTDRKWGKASNYDICVSSSIGIKETVDVIEAFVKSKLKDQF